MAEPLISRITEPRGRPSRRIVVVELDQGEALVLDLPASEVRLRALSAGDLLSPATVDELERIAEIEVCHRRALRLMASRPRSEEELRRRLVQADFSYLAIERVIERLLESGLLDDDAFARAFAAQRREESGHAPARIESELRACGVDRETAHRAAWGPYEREDIDPESLQLEQALELLRRKRRRYEGLDRHVARRRMAALLERSGYPGGVSLDAVDAILEEMGAWDPPPSAPHREEEGQDWEA